MTKLPQVCGTCHKLKPADAISRRKCKGRYNAFYHICDACAEKPAPIRRLNRVNQETPIERTVRIALQGCGFKCEAEYPVDGCLFDFAVPSLMLLIEVDSPSYHRYPRQKRRDAIKTKIAKKHEYKLVRVRPDIGTVDLLAIRAVEARRDELGVA